MKLRELPKRVLAEFMGEKGPTEPPSTPKRQEKSILLNFLGVLVRLVV
jgi:hypothetical protein